MHKAQQQKKRKGKQGKPRPRREYTVRVPARTPGIPDSTVVDLKFRTDFRLYGSNPVALRWVTNGAYDADPLLGGLKYQYFDVWTQFYSFNKVLSFNIDVTLCNLEPIPLNITMCHTNTDPGVTGVGYPAYALQPYGFSTTIASYAGGGAKLHYNRNLTPRHVVGDQLTTTAERYVGSDTTNPADLTYFGISAFDQITSLSNGLVGTYICTIRVKFFDRKKLDDTTLQGVYSQSPYTKPCQGQVHPDPNSAKPFVPSPPAEAEQLEMIKKALVRTKN